jgi:hypothetical protein
MKKKYPIKPTEKQLNLMKLYWAMLQQELLRFDFRACELEKDMARQTGIEGIEFFSSDDGFCGIGNETRTMKLIQQEELEKK